MAEEKHERVNMNWPPGLKDRIREHAGARGVTEFVVTACEVRLVDEDRVKTLEKEVDELRYLAQLLADRYVMGGDHEDREAFLMEVDLPSWMSTEGWPANLAKQVIREHVPLPPTPEERVPSPPPPVVGQAADEVRLSVEDVVGQDEPEFEEDEDLHRPMALTKPKAQADEAPKEIAFDAGPGNDLFNRVAEVAAQKGIDMSAAGLVPASQIQAPVHNHSWFRNEDDELQCGCGMWIDTSDKETYPNGIVRGPDGAAAVGVEAPEADEAPQPEPEPESEPTPAPALATRALDDFDVDF